MSPGMITGWPISRYGSGTSGWPGGKARVAPLRCTQTRLRMPSIVVLLELGDVVGHVVDQVHAKIFPGAAEDRFENTSRACHISSCRLHQAKFAAARIAPRYCSPPGCRPGRRPAAGRAGRCHISPAHRAVRARHRRTPDSPSRASRNGSSRRPCPCFKPIAAGGFVVEDCDRRLALRESDCPSRACRTGRRRAPRRDR